MIFFYTPPDRPPTASKQEHFGLKAERLKVLVFLVFPQNY